MHVSGKWGELFLLGVVLIGNDTDLGFCLPWVVNIIKCLRTILFFCSGLFSVNLRLGPLFCLVISLAMRGLAVLSRCSVCLNSQI